MLRVTIDINGEIIHQSAVYNTQEYIGNECIYRYLDDKRRTVRHKARPIPMGGIYLGIEILQKDVLRAWKQYKLNMLHLKNEQTNRGEISSQTQP